MDHHQETADFTGHLRELRERLIKILLSWGAGFALAWFFAGGILEITARPIAPYLEGTGGKLIFTGPMEKFLSYMKVSLFAGVFLSCPYWLFQIWRFVAPGLYREEKKAAAFFVSAGTALFFAGAAFAYHAVFPLTFKFLMAFGGEGEIPFISLKEHIGFFFRTALIFSLVFEAPLIMVFLTQTGLVSVEVLAKSRPYTAVGAAVLSALVTPPDIFSMLLMTGPLYLLFELSLFVSRRLQKPPAEPARTTPYKQSQG